MHTLVSKVQSNSLEIPTPAQSVADWPLVGKKLHGLWAQARADLPVLAKQMQPKLGELATQALGIVSGMGGSLLLFIASFIIDGIIMAFGEPGAQATQAIFERIAGTGRGAEFTTLSAATVRSVASGVIGIACIQALLVGLARMVTGVP